MAKFQNLNVSYEQMRSISVSDRVSLLKSGTATLSSLTPEEFSRLFPKSYYSGGSFNTSNITRTLSPETQKFIESNSKTSNYQKTRVEPTTTYKPASAINKIEKLSGVRISDPGAKAQLSNQQKEILDELKKNSLNRNDPRAQFLNKISDDDLKKAGIEKKTDERGNVVYGKSDISSFELQQEAQRLASPNVARVVSAGEGKPTVLEYSNGKVESRSGDRSWRNNNPGNMEYGPLAQRYGAIGSDGRFAIFRSPEEGRDAKRRLLFESNVYRGMTIEQAMEKYAPRFENKTDEYIAAITKAIGLPKNTNLSTLTDDQKKALFDTIQKREGRSSGKIDILREGLQLDASRLSASDLEKARQSIERRREQGIAETITAQLDAPSGLSEKAQSEYNKLSGGQKQLFHEAFRKLGNNSDAIDAINKAIDTNQRAGQNLLRIPQQLDATERAKIQAYNQLGFNLTGGAESRGYGSSLDNVDRELLGRFQRALQNMPEDVRKKVNITSGFRDPTNPEIQAMYQRWLADPNPKKLPMADPSKSKHGAGGMSNALDVKLSHLPPEEKKLAIQALKAQGLHTPVARETFEGPNHAHIEIRDRNDGIQAAADFESRLQSTVSKIKEATTPQPQTVVSSQTGQQNAGAVQGGPGSPGAPPVPTQAYGGNIQTDASEISAYPIGGLKGDNSVVVDQNQKPLFTMKTDETVSMGKGHVSVEPKVNPDSIEERKTPEPQERPGVSEAKETMQENSKIMATQQPNVSYGVNDVAVGSENPIHTASFMRSMAANRMQRMTDPLGGHFDHGASNLK